jgi:hypothetical protein
MIIAPTNIPKPMVDDDDEDDNQQDAAASAPEPAPSAESA